MTRFNTIIDLLQLFVCAWLICVLFLVVHEGGHAIVATALGSHVYQIYISPTGSDGYTVQDKLPGLGMAAVAIAGTAATVLGTLVALRMRWHAVACVFSLRMALGAINYDYAAGSDMAICASIVGEWAYAATAIVIITAAFAVITALRRDMRNTKTETTTKGDSIGF